MPCNLKFFPFFPPTSATSMPSLFLMNNNDKAPIEFISAFYKFFFCNAFNSIKIISNIIVFSFRYIIAVGVDSCKYYAYFCYIQIFHQKKVVNKNLDLTEKVPFILEILKFLYFPLPLFLALLAIADFVG